MWSLDVNASCTRLVTGASDNQLRVWALNSEGGGDEEGEGGRAAAAAAAEGDGVKDDSDVIAVYMGSVARQGNGEREGEWGRGRLRGKKIAACLPACLPVCLPACLLRCNPDSFFR